MEELSRKIAHSVAASLGCDAERERVIAYGLTALIQAVVTVLLVLILGIAVRAPAEALIICFSVSLLRKYSGGAHAGFIEECTAFSVIYCIVFALVSKWLMPYLHVPGLAALITAVYAAAYVLIYRHAPVDSPNKPIKSEKKKRRMRKGAFWTVSVYLAISASLLWLGAYYPIAVSCGLSLLFGVSWQMFTLTKAGDFFLHKLDVTVVKVFKIRKEVQGS